MKRFKVEMNAGQDHRIVEADSFATEDGWLIFHRLPPQGGPRKEYWRARIDAVVSVETQA